jgi:D-alanyl-D-alanine carboxypeptidase
VPLADAGGITVHADIAEHVAALLEAARADGIPLAGSGWRSTARQAELRVINGCPDLYTSPPSACRVPTAIPGRSRHEQGLAIDFSQDGHTLAGDDTGYAWLVAHADAYGLHNLHSEAWHWSVDGR